MKDFESLYHILNFYVEQCLFDEMNKKGFFCSTKIWKLLMQLFRKIFEDGFVIDSIFGFQRRRLIED